MEGPSTPGDFERELTDLRARAYGPDPDIQDDPAALARLVELEADRTRAAAVRARSGVSAALYGTPADVAEAAVSASAPAREPARLPGEVAAVSRGQRPNSARSGRSWLAAGAGVALVALTYGAGWLVGPHPDATLLPTAREDDEEILGYTGAIRELAGGIDLSTLQSYETFRGVEPWSAVDEYGNPCLIVIAPSINRLFEAVCTPREADLLADIEAWPALDEPFADGLPDGTVIRFHHRGNAVDVFVHLAPTGEG